MAEQKKSESKPKDEKVTKTDLSKAKSELRSEFNEKLDKFARAMNVDLDSMT